jgi:hypothetical protein
MIRKRLMTALLVAVSAVAFSGVASSAASAETFTLSTTACSGGTDTALCWSETETSELLELTGKQSETVSGGTTVLKVSNPEITIECKEASGSGVITQTEPLGTNKKGTTLSGTIVYKGCKIIANASIAKKCTIVESKETKKLKGTLNSDTELLLVPEAGTEFIEVEFLNNGAETCPATVKGKRFVTGEQQVEIVNGTKHELTKSGNAKKASKLKFFEEPAELTESLVLSFTGLEDWVAVTETA